MTHRTLAIGDIHGCDTALERMIAEIAPTPDDEIVVLGDVVDRGPDSRRCIDLLLELQQRCRLVFIKGNHEDMMLDALNYGEWAGSWLVYGGRETLDSYGGEAKQISENHREFLESGLDCYETDSTIFVHANLEPGVPIRRQSVAWLRWNHLTGREQPRPSGKIVVCGHTRLVSGVPATLPGWICIDTAACAGGWLTCLDVDTLQVLQTSETNQTRGPVPLDEIAEPYRGQH